MPTRPSPMRPVSWSFRDTIVGSLFTLLPLFSFLFYNALLSAGKTAPLNLTEEQHRTAAIYTIVATFVLEAIFLIAPYYFARKAALKEVGKENYDQQMVWEALGFRKPHSFWQAVGWGFLVFALMFLVNVLYSYLLEYLKQFGIHLQTNDKIVLERARYAPLEFFATMAGAVVFASFFEEVFFRGFLFPGLAKKLPVWVAALISAFLFGIAHMDPASFPLLFVFGLGLAFYRWKTDSIWPPIVLHLLNNATSALLIYLQLFGYIN